MQYQSSTKIAMLNAIITEVDSGSGNAYLSIRGGYPENVEQTVFFTEEVAATFPLNKPCGVVDLPLEQINFSFASNQAIISATTEVNRWRLHRSDGYTILAGTVSELNGSGEIRFSITDWEADGTTTATITFAAIRLQD